MLFATLSFHFVFRFNSELTLSYLLFDFVFADARKPLFFKSENPFFMYDGRSKNLKDRKLDTPLLLTAAAVGAYGDS